MLNRIKNAWSLGKSSWAVLQHDRELAWLPVIGGVTALVVGALFLGPIAAMLGGTTNQALPAAGYLLVFLGYCAMAIVFTLSRAAVVHGANMRMEGGDPSIAGSLRGAMAHWPAVALFAVISTTIGLILEAIEDQGFLGAIVSMVADAAWRLLTYLVLPVVIIEGTGAISGIKSSSALVKRTWGEQVTANVGFGLLGLALVLPAFLLAGALAGLGTVVAVVTSVAAVVWAVAVIAVISALTGIFQTALYRQATGRSIPAEFDAAELRGAVVPR